MSGKALFLDRDGTLIVDKHYLCDPRQVELLPGAAEALRDARDLGYLLFLFSNQSGIGRGYYTRRDAERVNARMEELLGLPHPIFAGVCMAEEAPEAPSRYRKPSPAYILETIAAHALDPAACYMVGDKEADVEAGLRAGIVPVYVRSGRAETSIPPARLKKLGVRAFAGLADFVATLRPPAGSGSPADRGRAARR